MIQNILKISQRRITHNESNPSFDVLSNPNSFRGNAIQDLENPDRVLIGGENQNSIETLSKIYKNWVPESKILHTNME